MPEDAVPIEDNVLLILRGADGAIKQIETSHNLVTTLGREGIADQILASPSVAKPGFMAVGKKNTAPTEGDTAMSEEQSPRLALTSKTRSGKIVTFKALWAKGEATANLKECGLFTLISGGVMYAHAIFGAIEKEAEDTLEIVWTTTVG